MSFNNVSINTMESDYNSVTDQAGIYAGSRGFDINVEGNTGLKGAVIDSKAGYENNTLNTGTLSFDDIDNKAEYDTKGYGFSYSGLTNEEKKQSDRPLDSLSMIGWEKKLAQSGPFDVCNSY